MAGRYSRLCNYIGVFQNPSIRIQQKCVGVNANNHGLLELQRSAITTSHPNNVIPYSTFVYPKLLTVQTCNTPREGYKFLSDMGKKDDTTVVDHGLNNTAHQKDSTLKSAASGQTIYEKNILTTASLDDKCGKTPTKETPYDPVKFDNTVNEGPTPTATPTSTTSSTGSTDQAKCGWCAGVPPPEPKPTKQSTEKGSIPEIPLPDRKQVERFFFRTLAYIYDFSHMVVMWFRKVTCRYIIQNPTVRSYWQSLRLKMEQAKKD